MFVESFKNNGIPYLRLVRNDRVTNKKGVKTSTKTVILNIGPLSRFDDGQPDYIGRLKNSFKAGCPLIPALFVIVNKKVPKMSEKIPHLFYRERHPYRCHIPFYYVFS